MRHWTFGSRMGRRTPGKERGPCAQRTLCACPHSVVGGLVGTGGGQGVCGEHPASGVLFRGGLSAHLSPGDQMGGGASAEILSAVGRLCPPGSRSAATHTTRRWDERI